MYPPVVATVTGVLQGRFGRAAGFRELRVRDGGAAIDNSPWKLRPSRLRSATAIGAAMTRFIFTVGTSNLALLPKEAGSQVWDAGRVGDISDPVALQRALDPFLVHAESLREEGSRLRQSGAASALRSLGAEAESLTRLARGDNPDIAPFTAADGLSLLASDTVAGVTAACIVAVLVGRWPVLKDVSAEEGVTDIPARRLLLAPQDEPTADVFVIRDLHPNRAESIPRSSRALARALLDCATSRGSEAPPVVAELSGGFKVTIPLLMSFLEYLGALSHRYPGRAPSRVQAWFRHEKAPDIWHLAGLRRLDAASLDAHQREVVAALEGYAPPTNVLEGYAYRTQADGIVPTDVAHGIQVLLTTPL